MKIFIVVFLLFLVVINNIQADPCIGDLSDVSVIALETGINITFTNPYPPHNQRTSWAGTIRSTMDNSYMPVYCVDLGRTVSLPDHNYSDTCSYVTSRVQFLLNNYYPYRTGYPGELADSNREAASVQATIWSYTDGLNLSTIADLAIKNRALVIKADAEANGLITQPIITFSLHPGVDPDNFYVRTVDENDNPIAISNIVLTISSGTLSAYVTATDSSGVSPEIIVSGAQNSSIITASGRVMYSQGRIVHGLAGNKQSMAIAYPVFGRQQCQIEWGALPVELSSFFSIITDNEVKLSWQTSSETNNDKFEIERKGTMHWETIGSIPGHGTSNVEHDYQFIDRNLQSGKYSYRLKQIDYNGNFEYHNLTEIVTIGVPDIYQLKQNYPNPFNPTTTIDYMLPQSGHITLEVYDNTGRRITQLLNEYKTAGYYQVQFNGSNLGSGIYYYRLTAGQYQMTKKMMLIK